MSKIINMKNALLFIAAFMFSIGGFAQSQKELIRLGDQAYESYNYASAVYFYKKIIEGGKSGTRYDVTYPYEINSYVSPVKSSDSTKALSPRELRQRYVINMIANSYQGLRDYDNAKEWYEKALLAPHDSFPNTQYRYAVSLMNLGMYDEAKTQLEEFIEKTDESNPYLNPAINMQAGCAFAQNSNNTAEGIVVQQMDSVFNRGISSFGVNYYEGELSLIYAAGRKGNMVVDPDKESGEYNSDLFITSKIGDNWDAPMRLEGPINTPMNEGAAAMSVDRTTLYYTQWDPNDRSKCKIMLVNKMNGMWMQPFDLGILNVDGYRSMNPTYTEDESRLYFASDRPGGYGGLDIWFCPIMSNGDLGPAENCGPSINTAEDENTPFHHYQSNTLFFSSMGHVGYGGYDIFKAKYDESAEAWTNPRNLGAPFNSSKDETYYVLDKFQKYGYLTSDREHCVSCDSSKTDGISGYCNKIYSFEKPELRFMLSGIVFDNDSGEPIPNALITFKDIRGNFDPFFIMTDGDGFYEKELEANMEIFLKAQKTGYFGDAATVSTKDLTESTELTQDFYLNKIPEEAIAIEGIEYDFDKATLRPKSKEILDELASFLTLNDNLVIEIQSHTDFRGDDNYNLDLSKRRAQSVVDYLVDKGIARERMIPKGYGETEPAYALDENKKPIRNSKGEYVYLTYDYIMALTEKDEQEVAHQRNRRTAFKVLSEDNESILESTPK